MPAVSMLLAQSRARGGQFHPGGMQWWLREVGRDGFEAFVWPAAADDAVAAFVMIDTDIVLPLSAGEPDSPTVMDLIGWTEAHLAARGLESMMTWVARGDPLIPELEARGYTAGNVELELMADIDGEPRPPELPDGFRFGTLLDITDQAFIEMHVAAWSDDRPSSYNGEWHKAVKIMPDFHPELVTIAFASDGTPAAYCIGWPDPISRTLEIEPLGTHRGYRRLGLARAVVHEVTRRAWQNGMEHVLVWNSPWRNDAAYRLYTSAGMTPRREILHLTRSLK
jgi:GNAT superfamily N-acetyltransferase